MPVTVFPAAGYSFRVTGTDDQTSNAAAWYLNDLNTLTTTPNTATNKTFYYENDNVAPIGTQTSVTIYTTSTVQIDYDARTFSIVGNDEGSSNFIPYFLNDLNILTSNRNTSNIRTFFINNYSNINLGNYVRVRITGSLYSEDIDVIARNNNSFTIAIPSNWPAISVGLTVSIGRYAYNPIAPYSAFITLSSSTSRTFSLSKPIGFPEVGSTLYALLVGGTYGVADPVGINSTLTNAVLDKKLLRLVQSSQIPIVIGNTKGIKVELKNDRISNTVGMAKSMVKATEPSITLSRQISLSTATTIQYLNYPLKILGSNLVRNFDLSWYIRDADTFVLTRSTSNFVTYSFINPNDPFTLGSYTKAKFYNPVWEKTVDIVTNTNNSITVLRTEEFPEVSQLSVFLGNTASVVSSSLSNANQVPLISYLKSPAIDPRSNLGSSIINRSGIKVVGHPVQLRTEKLILQNLIREPIVTQSRTATYTNFTATVFTDLIRVSGRSGITTDFTNYYIFENNSLVVTRSTSNFVTLFFNNPNNNQTIGPISAVRLISPRFDITLSVQSYTTDSVTIADILGFNNFQTAQSITDLSIRLGINFSDRSVSYSNSNVIPLVEKLKTSAITMPNTLIVPKVQVSSIIKDPGVRIRHTDFRVMTKVVGESRTLRTEQTSTAFLQKTQIQVKEPIVLPSRTVTTSSFTNTIFGDLIRITGSSGVTSDFANSYIFENNSISLIRSTASNITLYFTESITNIPILARLIGPTFNVTVSVQSYTTSSITIANIFDFNRLQSFYTINDLYVRLGSNFVDRSAQLNDANRIPVINPFKTNVSFNSRFDTLGNTKIRDRNFSTIEIPRPSFYRNISSLRDTITYQPSLVTIATGTTTLFSSLIDIGGTIRTTSTFISYYVREDLTLATLSTTTVTSTLLFANTVQWQPTPSVVRLFAYQIVNGNENPVYDIILPVVSVSSQSVTVNWLTYEYKLRVQLGSTINVSGTTYNNYFTGGLAVANLNTQKYKTDRQQVFSIGQGGVLRTANQKLSAITIPLAVTKFNQSIIVRGEGRTIPQRTATVTTSSSLILEPFPIYVWGKNETTSTAARWYYNDEDILRTTNSTSSLVTLYFDGIPIYQRTTAPFIKLFAPNAGYDYVYPVVTATIDSVTIQNIGIFPSVSGMYFYWARQGQTESISYNDVGQIPQLRTQKFRQFQDPTTNKIYSSFTSTEQGFIVYDRRVTGIAYVGTSTELTLNAPIIAPTQGQYAKIQYVDSNYYRTVPNTKRAVRFNGVDTFIRFSASTVIGAIPTRSTPVMAEAWINLDAAEGCIIMSEEYTGGGDPINLTLAVGNAPGVGGTRVWYGFYDGVAWAYATSFISLNAGIWYHIAGQFDGNQIRIYIDGVQDGTPITPIFGWNTTGNAGANFFVGRRWDTFAGDGQRPFFKGLIYQARVVQGQLVYTKNFVPPLNTALTENSGFTKFLACSFPIDQPLAQNWVGFPTPISYTIGGAVTFEVASIPPRYTFDAYPEEIYEINSATTTKIYLKGRIAYRPITNTEYRQDDLADRPINVFDVYFLGVSQDYPVIRSTFTSTTGTFALGNLRQSVPKVGFGIEIPRIGKTLSIPKLRETLGFASKSVVSINSSTQLTFSTTPLIVYGITASSSTFLSYYLNEQNILVTIPTGTPLATLYLGNNPEYYRPLGTTVRIVNVNNGYDRQFNIVASTIDSITITNPNDLPSVSGMVVYYGSVQTSFPSVNFSDSNAVGRINKNTVGQSWFEIRRETAGQMRQSLIAKGDRSDNQIYSNTNFVSQLKKGAISLRSTIEIPREFKFSTTPKIADPGRYQNPTYSITTGTETIFYSPVGLGRIASTTTFVTYYIYENNTISSIYSTGTQKVFNFSENINPSLGFSNVRIQGYRFETVGENIIFDITLPIFAITTNTISVNFPQPFPDLLYRASLGKIFTTFSQVFSGTNSVSLINPYKTPVIENNQRPASLGQMNKPITVVRDLQPTNNFTIGNYGRIKIKVAGDRTYVSTTTISTSAAQLIYLDPVAISGTNRSTSTFVSYYISEDQVFRTFNSTSANIILYFDRTVQVTADYTVARFTNFINYEFTTTIVSVSSQSVTIVNPLLATQTLPNGGLTVYLGKVWPGETFRRITNDSALQTAGINRLRTPAIAPSVGIQGIEIPTTVAKLSSTIPLRYISNINRLTATPVKIITSLRAEKNADPHRTRTVTTTTSLTYNPIVFRVYGTNLSTSTAVSWYLDDGDIIRTYASTSTELQLLLGELPIYLQLQGKNTHIRVVNDIGYDQQFTITNFTRDSVSIQKPIYFPDISTLSLYFGSLRTTDTLTWNDTNTVAKINFKWANWHTHLVQQPSYLNKSLISLREHARYTTGTSVLQKPVASIKGAIEIPRTGKTQSLINFREPIVLPSRQVSYTTTSTTTFYGPFLATGKLYSTSNFLTNYLLDGDIVNSYYRTGSTATLIASDTVLPVGQSFDLVKIEGYVTTLSNQRTDATGQVTVAFTSPGLYTFTIPASSIEGSVSVNLWGAGGAGGRPGGWGAGANGGAGGAASGNIILTPGTTVFITVGGGGNYTAGVGNTIGGGGTSSANGSDNIYGGGGGGFSAIFNSSARNQASVIILAGGGGGGGSSRAGTANVGGGGGGLIGQDGASPYDGKTSYRGLGGTQTAAGANASSDAVNVAGNQGALQGGNSLVNSYGGAGGGGYWGGSGGGYSEINTMGGGGGGSGFIGSGAFGNLFAATLTTPGDSANPLRGTAGNAGGPSTLGSGGAVYITYATRVTTPVNPPIEIYTKTFEATYPLTSYTANTVSFPWTGVIPDYRWNFYLGKTFTTTRAITTNNNQVSIIDRLKYVPSSALIEVPRSNVLEKRSIVVKDFVNNIRVGQARSLTKIASDRSYSVTTSTIYYSTTTIYQDPVVISGINRSQTNFAQTYINDGDLITVTNNTSTIVTLLFAQNIPYTGLANAVRIARYGAGFYVGNRFFITNTEFEVTYPILSYTTSSVTINIGNNFSYFDPNIRSLAAYIGQDYQQPSSITTINTSTLAVSQVAAYKPTVGITAFALTPITAKLSVANKVKGIDVPLRIDAFKPRSTAKLQGILYTTATGKLVTIPSVRDGYYPNVNTRTRTVTTNTTIVYEPDVYTIFGTDLSTSSFITDYIFETNILTTANNTASTMTLFLGSLPVIDPGLGLYVRITNNSSFNTVTQVLSRQFGSVVINQPANLPSISSLLLYFGALRNVETVNYTDTNFNQVENFYTQTSVATSLPPVTPREMLYYSAISPIKFGRKITVYPNQAVSPVNNIPPKTRTATTNINTIVYDPEPFFIYGTTDKQQVNLSWYTTETNFISFEPQPALLELKLGGRGYSYGLTFFNQYAYVRLINNTGYDQWFGIIARSNDSITIYNPYNLPSISTLSMYFGRIRQTDFLFWNDQGIVPTFATSLSTSLAVTKIILAGGDLITIPYSFRSSNKVIESTIYSTATSLINRTTSPLRPFTEGRAGISYNKFSYGFYSSPIALSSTTSVVGTSTILNLLTQSIGQQAYTTPGTYTWTAPANVYYVSAVAIGGGGSGGIGRNFPTNFCRGGGGGGGLGWKNLIPVIPLNTYTVVVGAGGAAVSAATPGSDGLPGSVSYFINSATVAGLGGTGATNVGSVPFAGVGGGYIGDGGGSGGAGGVDQTVSVEGRGGGGGGAGGYVGNGGRGGDGTNSATPATQPTSGSGGGGGGGSSVYGTFNDNGNAQASSGGGGGTGIQGLGANGAATPNQVWVGNPGSSIVLGGQGGSSGTQGGNGQTAFATGAGMTGGNAGSYGAGGGGTGAGSTLNPVYTSGAGGGGAVRIIWGSGRGFPSQFTADATSIDITSQIVAGSGIRIVDGVGNIGFAEILAITTTSLTVKTIDLSSFVGNPSTWTVTPWDNTVYPLSSVLVTTGRSTSIARENLVLGQLAPGLRYNRTITQGISFAPYPNNIQTGPVKSATTLKSPTNIPGNTVTNFVFGMESENTATFITTGIGSSSKNIYYYTSLAQGIRGGTSLPSKIVAFRETIPSSPAFASFIPANTKLISVRNPDSGNLGKQVISIRHIPTQFDRVGALRILPSMRGDTLRATVAFVDRPKLAPTGWNAVEVVSRGVIDKRFTVIKSGDLRNFTADKLNTSLKVVPDSNRFYGDQRIRIVQYLQTPASRIRADLVERAKIPSVNTQVFETPRPAQVNRSHTAVKSIISNIHIVDRLNFVSKYIATPNYIPVSNVNKANLLDLRQVTFREQRGKLDIATNLKEIPYSPILSLLQKPLTKLAFKDSGHLLYKEKLGNLQKGQFKAFFLDNNLGLLTQPAKFPDLRTVQFRNDFGKIAPSTAQLRTGFDIDARPFGIFRSITKVGTELINFNITGKVKISSKGIDPSGISLTANTRGLITKFTAAKSGNLHDPSTRRAVPIQFWN